ncbi:MAG: hypothetical protein SGJ27_10555 [Candidatus Melainabacteria bacterium]|nr:hypothetical protein [Candidatus Melainabacteria bacterium]
MSSEGIANDPDMQNATIALLRAAKRARQIAQQTGTAIVVIRDGVLVREIPQPLSTPEKEKSDEFQ